MNVNGLSVDGYLLKPYCLSLKVVIEYSIYLQKLHSSIRYPPGRETEELPKEYWNAM